MARVALQQWAAYVAATESCDAAVDAAGEWQTGGRSVERQRQAAVRK